MVSIASTINSSDSDEVVLLKVVKHLKGDSGNKSNISNNELINFIRNIVSSKNVTHQREIIDYVNNPTTLNLGKIAKKQVGKEFKVLEKHEHLIFSIFENMEELSKNRTLLRYIKSRADEDLFEFISDSIAGHNLRTKNNIKTSLKILKNRIYSEPYLASVIASADNKQISELLSKIVFISKNPTSFTHEIRYVGNLLEKIVRQGAIIKNIHNLNAQEGMRYFEIINNSKNIDKLILADLRALGKLLKSKKKESIPSNKKDIKMKEEQEHKITKTKDSVFPEENKVLTKVSENDTMPLEVEDIEVKTKETAKKVIKKKSTDIKTEEEIEKALDTVKI